MLVGTVLMAVLIAHDAIVHLLQCSDDSDESFAGCFQAIFHRSRWLDVTLKHDDVLPGKIAIVVNKEDLVPCLVDADDRSVHHGH